MSMLFRRARRSLSAVLLGALASMPIAATAHAAPEHAASVAPDPGKLTVGEVYVGVPGDGSAVATFTVRNTGTVPVQGFSLSIGRVLPAFKVDADFANCDDWAANGLHDWKIFARCLFPVTLAAGATYTVELPVRGADAWPSYNDRTDFSINSWSDEATETWRALEKKTGPTLALRPAAPAMPAAAFEDRGKAIEYEESQFRISQGASTQPDLAAFAKPVTAHRGDVIHPEVGVRNDGRIGVQNLVNTAHGGAPQWRWEIFKITVPKGVTVVDVDRDCHRSSDGSEWDSGPFANEKEFTCFGTPWVEHPLMPRERYIPRLGLRLDQDVHDAVGTVTVLMYGDNNPANNTARYVINPTAPSSTSPATPGATTAPAAAADTSGGGAGTGGLPITGPSLAGFLAAGAGILVTGIALLVVTRRRTPRAKS
ncbi:hypothetical protein [Krasilnikovia sp. M28-CT-15]|uniref:hypothetical protein n=1 Tax=Krasilnikovia sp. M28-CT-15 TaxID=3373540 RepID=UPI003875E0D4